MPPAWCAVGIGLTQRRTSRTVALSGASARTRASANGRTLGARATDTPHPASGTGTTEKRPIRSHVRRAAAIRPNQLAARPSLLTGFVCSKPHRTCLVQVGSCSGAHYEPHPAPPAHVRIRALSVSRSAQGRTAAPAFDFAGVTRRRVPQPASNSCASGSPKRLMNRSWLAPSRGPIRDAAHLIHPLFGRVCRSAAKTLLICRQGSYPAGSG